MSYCLSSQGHEWHGPYHDREYGFPIAEDDRLFERLVLEINQAGLSWLTILKKKQGFFDAFEGFNIDKVAAYGEAERARLLADASIIRNRRKIEACIANARAVQGIQREHGTFRAWFYEGLPGSDLAELQRALRKTFAFMGPEIARMWLGASGRVEV